MEFMRRIIEAVNNPVTEATDLKVSTEISSETDRPVCPHCKSGDTRFVPSLIIKDRIFDECWHCDACGEDFNTEETNK